MDIDFRWNKPIPKIIEEATGGKRTCLFMANEAKRLMDPYIPARNLALAQNVKVYAEEDEGIVHYLSPYAQYQYHGILMVSRITGSPWARRGESKVATGRKLKHSKSRHPLATAEWDKAMKAAKGKAYAQAVQNYIRGSGS